MTPSHRTDFAVVNTRGVTVQTFNTRQRAIEFANHNARDLGALVVQRVAYRVTRTVIHEVSFRSHADGQSTGANP